MSVVNLTQARPSWEELEAEAREILRAQTPEETVEGDDQHWQGAWTLYALDILCQEIPGLQVFGDLMLLYADPLTGGRAWVSPDNMLTFGARVLPNRNSYALAFDTLPSLVFEYSSDNSREKDLGASYQVYESLGIPYYVRLDLPEKRLEVYALQAGEYRMQAANPEGRWALPLSGLPEPLTIGLIDGVLRFWYQDRLLPTNREALKENVKKDQTIQQLDQTIRQKDQTILQKDQALLQKDQMIQQKDQALQQKDQTIEQQAKAVLDRDLALKKNIETLRRTVAALAQVKSRTDILERLSQTDDPAQLDTWAAELSGG